MEGSRIVKKRVREEMERQARFHSDTGSQYGERTRETTGEVADAYSSLCEAHYEMSRALKIAVATKTEVPT